MTAYADGADLAARYDIRILADLASDDGAALTRAAVIDNENIAIALGDASGRVEVAMRQGKRYLPADLASLTGNSLSHLKRIVCAVAMAALIERRPEAVSMDVAERITERAEQYLIALQKGENIFGLPDDSDTNATMIDTDGPTAIEIETRNLMTERMSRHFPSDSDRNPLDRG